MTLADSDPRLDGALLVLERRQLQLATARANRQFVSHNRSR
jgi:hypothetical protein